MEKRPRVFIPLGPDRERRPLFCDQHVGNRIVAKIIPVALVGAAGFTTWVYIAQVCGMSPVAIKTWTKWSVNFVITHENNVGLGGNLGPRTFL